jgi:hypothetical protein
MGTEIIYYYYTALCRALAVFSFPLSHTQSIQVGRRFSPLQGLCLNTGQHKQNKLTVSTKPRVGFEPTTLVFERAKRVHALNSAYITPKWKQKRGIRIEWALFVHTKVCVRNFAGPSVPWKLDYTSANRHVQSLEVTPKCSSGSNTLWSRRRNYGSVEEILKICISDIMVKVFRLLTILNGTSSCARTYRLVQE